MKLALVYDRLNKWGGAERVLLALHELWPDAPLYTAVYEPRKAPWAGVFDVIPSFLQRVPLARTYHELFPWLTPMAFESFSFDQYDVVISVTSAEAKSIITKPHTLHICYCLTPTRYLWSGYEDYENYPGMGRLNVIARTALAASRSTLGHWDTIAAARPDSYIAISQHVAERITRYYDRAVDAVIYPPVDLGRFEPRKSRQTEPKQPYFLVVSRLIGYKRVDLVIDAFNILGLPLKVIGDGRASGELKRRANRNIEFIRSHLTDEELVGYYQSCRALVFAGQEDFGLVAVEAQACGKPVISYRNSGMAEIILEGITGLLFREQNAPALIKTVQRFMKSDFDSGRCRENAKRFDTHRFRDQMKNFVSRKLRDYRR